VPSKRQRKSVSQAAEIAQVRQKVAFFNQLSSSPKPPPKPKPLPAPKGYTSVFGKLDLGTGPGASRLVEPIPEAGEVEPVPMAVESPSHSDEDSVASLPSTPEALGPAAAVGVEPVMMVSESSEAAQDGGRPMEEACEEEEKDGQEATAALTRALHDLTLSPEAPKVPAPLPVEALPAPSPCAGPPSVPIAGRESVEEVLCDFRQPPSAATVPATSCPVASPAALPPSPPAAPVAVAAEGGAASVAGAEELEGPEPIIECNTKKPVVMVAAKPPPPPTAAGEVPAPPGEAAPQGFLTGMFKGLGIFKGPPAAASARPPQAGKVRGDADHKLRHMRSDVGLGLLSLIELEGSRGCRSVCGDARILGGLRCAASLS
jgi:hypothetical protein